jgi:hypothetical protein
MCLEIGRIHYRYNISITQQLTPREEGTMAHPIGISRFICMGSMDTEEFDARDLVKFFKSIRRNKNCQILDVGKKLTRKCCIHY